MDPQSENPAERRGAAPSGRTGVPRIRRAPGPDSGGGALARVRDRRPADVEVRRQPTQARGAATFDAILDATARLLEEGGHEIVTTNLIAEVAGVNIATLYQYFPSKEAILLALFRRDTDFRIAAGEEPFEQSAATDDWRQVAIASIDVLVRLRRGQRGASALRRAMRSLPDLQAYECETMIASARRVATWLVRSPGVDIERAEIMGLCLVEVLTTLLDLWSLDDLGIADRDDRIIEELKRMVIAYLAPVLDR